MSQATSIGWTDVSWNPVHGCSKVSPGCAHCYAETLSRRYDQTPAPWTPENAAENVILKPHKLREPLSNAKHWRGLGAAAAAAGKTEGKLVFVNSMSDLFHPRLTGLPEDTARTEADLERDLELYARREGEPRRPKFIAQVFAVMSLATQHTFQVLTKRPKAMAHLLSHANFWLEVNAARMEWGYAVIPGGMSDLARGDQVLPNVWLGTSIENRQFVERAEWLRSAPAAVRFISAEPLLGPLIYDDTQATWSDDFTGPELDLAGIDWLIVGGESGPGHRRVDPAWVSNLRAASRDGNDGNAVAFFFKQWGGARPDSNGRELDGCEWSEFPTRCGTSSQSAGVPV